MESKNFNYDVVVRGAYGAKNFGDDALIYSLLNNFFQDKKIAVVGKENNYWSKIFPKVDYFSTSDDYTLNTELLVYGGGTQFYNFDDLNYFFKKIYKAIISPKIILNKISPPKTITVNFKKDLYLGIGLGPFKSNKKKEIVLNDFLKKENIYVRDNLSVQYVKGNCIKIDDICLMDYKFYRTHSAIEKNDRIALIIRDWEFDSNSKHIDKIIEFYSNNSDLKMDFIFFGNDLKAKQKLRKKQISYIEWNPKEMTIVEFSKMLSAYKLIISSRYHGIIFSIIHKIPAIAIEIEPKLLQVSKEYSNIQLWKNDYNLYNLRELVDSHQEFNDDLESCVISICEVNTLLSKKAII